MTCEILPYQGMLRHITLYMFIYRCLGPGYAYRLFTEVQYAYELLPMGIPEIQRYVMLFHMMW